MKFSSFSGTVEMFGRQVSVSFEPPEGAQDSELRIYGLTVDEAFALTSLNVQIDKPKPVAKPAPSAPAATPAKTEPAPKVATAAPVPPVEKAAEPPPPTPAETKAEPAAAPVPLEPAPTPATGTAPGAGSLASGLGNCTSMKEVLRNVQASGHKITKDNADNVVTMLNSIRSEVPYLKNIVDNFDERVRRAIERVEAGA